MISGVQRSLVQHPAALEEFVGPYEVMSYIVMLVLNVSEHEGGHRLLENRRKAFNFKSLDPLSFSNH